MTLTLYDWMRNGRLPGMTWLAGYPRSGAALIRTIFAHAFGHRTASLYDEDSLGPLYAEAVGLIPARSTRSHIASVVRRQKLLTIKTHELPRLYEAPAIIIVRDGRRTLDSLHHFYREVNEICISMGDLIEGKHPWGDWSAWIRAWKAGAAPESLWLRYEDIMADLSGAIDEISEHFDIQPIARTIPPFDRLHGHNPTIFRRALIDGNAGMTRAEESLFWDRHSKTMDMLGYPK